MHCSGATPQHMIRPEELFKYSSVSTHSMVLAIDQYHKNVHYNMLVHTASTLCVR